MLKKFINNELSEREVDTMMTAYFKKKQEIEFKDKWREILREDLKPEQKGVVAMFRKRIYATVSAASILILVGVLSMYFYSSNIPQHNSDYTIETKGLDDNIIKLNDLINNRLISEDSRLSERGNSIIHLYNQNKYKSVLIKIDALFGKDEGVVSDDILFTAGVSAIKLMKYDKAVVYLSKIDKGSNYYIDAKEIIPLVKKIK